MSKTLSIIRIAILFAIFSIGMVLLFGTEQDLSTSAFLFHVCLNKALALTAFFFTSRLYKRWSKVDPIISKHNKAKE